MGSGSWPGDCALHRLGHQHQIVPPPSSSSEESGCWVPVPGSSLEQEQVWALGVLSSLSSPTLRCHDPFSHSPDLDTMGFPSPWVFPLLPLHCLQFISDHLLTKHAHTCTYQGPL